jgi:hypothetical protein
MDLNSLENSNAYLDTRSKHSSLSNDSDEHKYQRFSNPETTEMLGDMNFLQKMLLVLINV